MDSLGGVDILWTKTFGDEFDDRGYDIAILYPQSSNSAPIVFVHKISTPPSESI